MGKELDQLFDEAYEVSSNTDIKLPPDVMLQFYAYYKQATKGNNYEKPSGNIELRNAFKLNAWFQLNYLTEDEAKKEYIKLENKYLKIKFLHFSLLISASCFLLICMASVSFKPPIFPSWVNFPSLM